MRRSPRWWLGVLFLCALFMTGIGVVGLSISGRPLNDMEQRLVGTWRNTTSPAVMTFHVDRTITNPGFPPGIWSIRNATLSVFDSTLEKTILGMLGRKRERSFVVTFHDDDNISVLSLSNGGTSQYQRVEDTKTQSENAP